MKRVSLLTGIHDIYCFLGGIILPHGYFWMFLKEFRAIYTIKSTINPLDFQIKCYNLPHAVAIDYCIENLVLGSLVFL